MIRLGLVMVCLSSSVLAQTNWVKVTGDRVSLRSRPSLESDVLGRAMRGEEFIRRGYTNGWVAVEAPVDLKTWVAGEYLSNNVVLPKRLNVRAGPNKNYAVIAFVEQGDVVTPVNTFNTWVQIAPPAGTSVWMSEQYIEPVITEPVYLDDEEGIKEELPVLDLTLDPSLPQGVKDLIEGTLERAHPGLYQLRMEEEVRALVRGQHEQLEPLIGAKLRVEGLRYYVTSTALPVVQAEQITVLSGDME